MAAKEDWLEPINEDPELWMNVEHVIRVTALDMLRLIGAHRHNPIALKRDDFESDALFAEAEELREAHNRFCDEWHSKLRSRWKHDPVQCWNEVRERLWGTR